MLTRRNFLSALAATTPQPAYCAARRVIDTHTHFYNPARSQGVPWPPKTDSLLYRTVLPDEYELLTKGHGVIGTVVVEASPWFDDNQWILDLALEYPILCGLIGHLEPGAPGFASKLGQLTQNRLFRGIRLNENAIAKGLAEAAFVGDMQRLAARGLVLDAIGSAKIFGPLVRLSDKIPKLKICIDHLPFDPLADPKEQAGAASAMVELGRRPHVYAKVSGVLRRVNDAVANRAEAYRPQLDELWRIFGPKRLVYGSNWPVSNRLASYAMVIGVVSEYFEGKGSSAAQNFFYRNSQDCYQWIKRR